MNNDPSKTPVKNLMTKDVVMMPAEHTVKDAAKVMDMEGVGSLIIMKNNEPAGIMTERDFATKVVAHECPASTDISKVMTSPVVYMGPEESVLKASEIMLEKKIRKIPIYDSGKILGIITATDLVRFFRFSATQEIKGRCPLHTDEQLVKTELTDGTKRLYCSKCERFFALDE
ncbi:MAG TPA: CBS domain-containing protein [Nitrosopumilaceae archaeon]|nr:CBS domain-containing protein [Nitrosopumilaceae archaeon]